MIDNRYYVEPAHWSVDQTEIDAVREQVFVAEQGISREAVWDGVDAKCVHVIARNSADRSPIGVGRMDADGKIGRMAVLADWRSAGVGGALLQALVDQASERHLAQIHLHAQVSAVRFYEGHGFAVEGDGFVEAGIEHRKMSRRLPQTSAPNTGAASSSPSAPSKLITTDSLLSCRETTLAVMKHARHELCIYTRDLEAPIYDQDDTIEQFRRIALSGARARLRLLVQDPTRARHDGHRLVLLAHRLTTPIGLRQPHPDDLQYNAAFITNDCGGYLYRSQADRFEGEGDLYNPLRCAELQRYFDQIWERAQPIDEFRRLNL